MWRPVCPSVECRGITGTPQALLGPSSAWGRMGLVQARKRRPVVRSGWTSSACVPWVKGPSLGLFRSALSWWLSRYRICLQCRCTFNLWVRGIPWRRKWLPTPVFLPGESHGQRSLVDYSPWCCKESDRTEQLTLSHFPNECSIIQTTGSLATWFIRHTMKNGEDRITVVNTTSLTVPFSTFSSVQFSSVQLLSRFRLFATTWTAAHQASWSITKSHHQELAHLPRACSNSCPSSWWCHPTISSSVGPFSSCLQSFPAAGSFSNESLPCPNFLLLCVCFNLVLL